MDREQSTSTLPLARTNPGGLAADFESQIRQTRGRSSRPLTLLADLLRKDRREDDSRLRPDIPRAVRLCKRAIELDGNPNALNILGEILTSNTVVPSVPNDPPRAVSLWEVAILHGHKLATYNLAVALESGLPGVPSDPARAAELYSDIADDDSFKSVRFNLAWLLSSGLPGVPQDPVRAAELYDAIVTDEGDVNAMFNLACVLSQGSDDLPRDNIRAAALYERAIRACCHACSMHNLGVLLSTGEDGLTRDIDRALSLLLHAVENGRREANFDLALVLANDDDGAEPRDFPRAMEAYETVCNQLDHMGAMINLAEVLWEGKHGVPKNPERAMTLWEKAIAQGLNYEPSALERLGIQLDDSSKPSEDPEAIQMRNHATSQGWHLIAMCNLAEMLLSGAVPVDVNRAIRFYETALADPQFPEVRETQEVDFEDTFKVVREMLRQPDGVNTHLTNAMKIYNLLADLANDSHAMFLLGELYMQEKENIPKATEKAVEMYQRAIELGDRDAMLALGEMWLTGIDILKEVGHAADLFIRILAEGKPDSALSNAAAVYLALLWTG